MSREEEPPFVIRDPSYVKESTNCTSLLHILNGRWLVGLGGDSHEFGFQPADFHPHKFTRASRSSHADHGTKMAMSSASSRSVGQLMDLPSSL